MQQLRLFIALALNGVLVLVSQFCLLGVCELNICGSVHHA